MLSSQYLRLSALIQGDIESTLDSDNMSQSCSISTPMRAYIALLIQIELLLSRI